MSKRVCAALLALLIGVLACPAALAANPPAPPSGFTEQQEPTEVSPAPEPPPVQEPTPPTPEQTEETQPPEEPPAAEPPPEDPTEPPEDAGCNTIESLTELVAQNEDGTVTVTGDLTVPEGGFTALKAETPVTVDLGPYGITVPADAFLSLDGPITLTGDGAPRPLLTVYGGLDTVNGPALSAQGEHAVAVQLSGGQWYPGGASVHASGANACAVEVQGTELILYRVQLSAEGENSLCLRSDRSVRLILCQAQGEGALADVPDLILDGTVASPTPEGARIIRREAGPGDTLSENGLCLPVGAAESELSELIEWRLGDEIHYSLYDSAGEEALMSETAAGSWTGGPVDLSRPGTYPFTGTPAESLGDVPLPARTVWLYVVDPEKPWLAEAEMGGGGASLLYFREIQGAQSLTLWYSVDGGETWQDAAALPGAEIRADGAFLGTLPLTNHDYRFQLKVQGGPMAGKSNVLPFAYYDDRHWNGGGDWDGGDRNNQGELPPPNEVVPPPDPDNETPTPPDHQGGGDTPSRPDHGGGHTPTPTPEPVPEPTPEPAPGPSPSIPPTIIYIEEKEPEETPLPPPDSSPAETPGAQSTELQDIPQTPAPTAPAPQTVAPRPAVPAEATVSLTAAELEDQLAANPAGVTLLGGHLKVFLPAELLADASDGLDAQLNGPEAGRFEIRFWTGGKEVAGFEGGAFTVTVPAGNGWGTPFCIAPDGTEIAGSALTEDRVAFSLTDTGTYTLSFRSPDTEPAPLAEPPAPEEPAPSAPILPLTLGAAALLLVGGGALLYGRRRKK